MLHEPDKKTVIGNVPITNPNPGTAAATLKVVSANGLRISGTGMTRPGFGAVALGGPAKAGANGLSGNSFRPRHF
jgi:hypothetical protein